MNKNVAIFIGMGFTVIIDLLVFTYISIYIRDYFGLPDYVVLIGIFLGLFSSFYMFYKAIFLKGKK